MSSLDDLVELLRRALTAIPPEDLFAAVDVYGEVETTLAALASESNNTELSEASQCSDQAHAEILAALRACKTVREHVLKYLAEVAASNSSSVDDALRPHPPNSSSTSVPPAPQRDQRWADDERAKLPRYVTSGCVIDEHGNRWLEQSGASNRDKSIEQHDRTIIDRAHSLLNGSDQIPRPRHHQQRLDVVDHVEVKTAMKMRESGTRSLDLVLNNTMCPSTPGRVSCRRAVRAILRRGDTLRVWEAGPHRTDHHSRSGSRMISVFIERVPNRMVAATAAEVEDVLRALLSGPEAHPPGMVVDPHVIADIYSGDVTGDDEETEELPVGWLHVSVHPEHQVGALNYTWTDGAVIDSWESRGPAEGESLLYSTHSGNTFRTDAGVALAVVADAVREFARTGDRPTCVPWRQGVLV